MTIKICIRDLIQGQQKPVKLLNICTLVVAQHSSTYWLLDSFFTLLTIFFVSVIDSASGRQRGWLLAAPPGCLC